MQGKRVIEQTLGKGNSKRARHCGQLNLPSSLASLSRLIYICPNDNYKGGTHLITKIKIIHIFVHRQLNRNPTCRMNLILANYYTTNYNYINVKLLSTASKHLTWSDEVKIFAQVNSNIYILHLKVHLKMR